MSPPQERGAGERRGRREEGQVSEVAARDGLVRVGPASEGPARIVDYYRFRLTPLV